MNFHSSILLLTVLVLVIFTLPLFAFIGLVCLGMLRHLFFALLVCGLCLAGMFACVLAHFFDWLEGFLARCYESANSRWKP